MSSILKDITIALALLRSNDKSYIEESINEDDLANNAKEESSKAPDESDALFKWLSEHYVSKDVLNAKVEAIDAQLERCKEKQNPDRQMLWGFLFTILFAVAAGIWVMLDKEIAKRPTKTEVELMLLKQDSNPKSPNKKIQPTAEGGG